MMQSKEKPDFQPPSKAWEGEKKSAEESTTYKQVGEIKLPTHLATAAEVISLVRLTCGISTDTWLSIFFLGPNVENPDGALPVTLLRDANTKGTLDFLSKPKSTKRLYVKNVRPKPKRLAKQTLAYLEERENLLAKRTGNCWGIDWETQLVGAGSGYPRAGEVPIVVGDAVVIEIPTTDQNQEFNYTPSIYMDGTEVLSRPVEEVIEAKVKKKKKKKGADTEEKPPDNLLQLSFVGLQEGTCVMFVDISWEDQESKVCVDHQLPAPVKENSIARIGPISVDVQKTGAAPASKDAKPGEKTFMWWNGEKWSNKKGPVKKKGKK